MKPEDVKLLKMKDQFWEKVLTSWASFNYYHLPKIDNQMIWYNSEIRIENKLVDGVM